MCVPSVNKDIRKQETSLVTTRKGRLLKVYICVSTGTSLLSINRFVNSFKLIKYNTIYDPT